jgi:uncharacterized glyoxalase superfamily protein PhnB
MAQPATAATLTSIAPVFLAADVVRTAEWYRDYLGFTVGDYFTDHEHDEDGNDIPDSTGPAFFVIINNGPVSIQISRGPEGKAHHNRLVSADSYEAYINVTGVRALFARLKSAGAQFAFEITDEFYGMTDFAVLDPDGRAVLCGEPTSEARP